MSGTVAGAAASGKYLITTYVRGYATYEITASSSVDLSVTSNGIHSAGAAGKYLLSSSTLTVSKPPSSTGTFTNSGTNNQNRSGSLGCSSVAENDGCTTFAEYPGVTYCKPEGLEANIVFATVDNDGPTSATIDLSAEMSLSLSVTRGSSTPSVVISDPYVGGSPVSDVPVGSTVTVYNNSYDPDENLGSTAREGICSAAWEVLSPNGSTLTTGSNNVSVSFSTSQAGVYTVNLTVTDNEGNTAQSSSDVVVEARTPTPGDECFGGGFGYSCGSGGCSAHGGSTSGPGTAGSGSYGGIQNVYGSINSGTGNNHVVIVDPVSTRGYPLTNNIHINSQAVFPSLSTSMGNASFTYGIRFLQGSVDNVLRNMVIDADGQVLDFGPVSGSITPGRGVFSTLAAITGGWELSQAGAPESINEAGNFTYTFDSNGKLTKLTDPSGNEQNVTYDSNDDIEEVEDVSSGRSITFEYDTPGYIARVVEGGGSTVVHLGYSSNRLSSVQVKNSTGTIMREVAFTYNGDGLLQTIKRDNDADTELSFTYVNAGNGVYLANFSDTEGYATNINYFVNPSASGAKYRISRLNSQGGTIYFDFNDYGQLIQKSLPAHSAGSAATWTYTYNSGGLLASVADYFTTTTYTYNSLGLPTQIAETDAQTLTVTYSGADLLSVSDQDGTIVTLTYADTSNPHSPTSVEDGAANEWTVSYNAYGQITTLTPPTGSPTGAISFAYEENTASSDYGYLRSVTNAEGDVVTYDLYSTMGDVLSVTTSPSFGIDNTTEYEYDADRRLIELTWPDAKTQEWSYSGHTLESTLDEAGNLTEYEWCKGCGKPTKYSFPLAKELAWDYDADRSLSSYTDAMGEDTTYTYGNAGEIIQEDYPDGTYTEYEYGSGGKIDKKTTARGTVQTIGYNDAGRINLLAHNSPSLNDINFYYHADGRLSEFRDEASITTISYDAARRVDEIDYDFSRSGLSRDQVVEFTYFPDGLVETMTWKDNGTTVTTWTYDYDQAGRLIEVSNGFGDSVDYTYDGEGKILTQTNSNGTSTEYTYNEDRDWVTEIDHKTGSTSFETFTLEYDGGADTVGNITEVTELAGAVVTYGYDDLYRLTSEARTVSNTYSYTYTYDLAGNITHVNSNAFATYNEANELATVPGGSLYVDGAGNLKNISGTGLQSYVYTHDAKDQLRTHVLGSTTMRYEYNALNRRVYKDHATNSSDRWYVYAGDMLLGEVGTTGVKTVYTWGADGLAATRSIANNSAAFHHYGPQGETRRLTGTSGTVTDTYVYTAYGKSVASSGSTYNPHKYGGKYGYYTDWHGPTDAIYTHHRWYSPQIMRWHTRDPIKYDGDDNMYLYAKGNPVRYVDPDGLDTAVIGIRPPKLDGGGYNPGTGDPGHVTFTVIGDGKSETVSFGPSEGGTGQGDGNYTFGSGPYKNFSWPISKPGGDLGRACIRRMKNKPPNYNIEVNCATVSLHCAQEAGVPNLPNGVGPIFMKIVAPNPKTLLEQLEKLKK